MKSINSIWRGLLHGTVALVMAGMAASANGHSPKVLPQDRVHYGRTYSDWSAAWWQWCLSIPHASHPLFGNGDASVGQTGPVWFLGGNFAGGTGPVVRNCTIPKGKALFFPVVNFEDSTAEEDVIGNPGTTINALRAIIEGPISESAGHSSLLLEINGHRVRNLGEKFRVRSTAFSYTMPADNIWSQVYGTPFAAGLYSPAVDDGVYVMLAPLPVGNHVIHFHAEIPSFGFVVDVTYNITVAN